MLEQFLYFMRALPQRVEILLAMPELVNLPRLWVRVTRFRVRVMQAQTWIFPCFTNALAGSKASQH